MSVHDIFKPCARVFGTLQRLVFVIKHRDVPVDGEHIGAVFIPYEVMETGSNVLADLQRPMSLILAKSASFKDLSFLQAITWWDVECPGTNSHNAVTSLRTAS